MFWNIHKISNTVAVKRKDLLVQVMAWMDLTDNVQNEEARRGMCCVLQPPVGRREAQEPCETSGPWELRGWSSSGDSPTPPSGWQSYGW